MFKRIILSLFICLSIYKPVLSAELKSQRFFDNTGGLIDHISPLLIPDKNASALQNITMDDRGQLSKRNGYTVIISTFALDHDQSVNSTWTVTGGTFHKSTSGSDFFAIVVGTCIYRANNTYNTYTNVTGTVTVNATQSNLVQSTHIQDKAVFCNQLDRPFYVGSSGNAQALDTNMTTFSSATTCATYGNYFVVANTVEASVAFPSRVRWSDLNNLNSFPSLNFIDVEPDDGDSIIGMIPFDESVYIFKKRSIYRMLITGVDGSGAFIIRPISRNIGAWSKNSIKVIPNTGIMFLAQNTTYLLSDNGLTPVGDPIQRTFDTIQRSQWANSVAGVYPKKYQYWLAVSTTGSTNNISLVYDYVQHNWTVYDDMNISMLSQAEDSTGDNILLSGDYQATVYKHDNGSTDHPHGTTTAIVGSYTTANLLMGDPEITKGFKYLYLFTQGDALYTLTVNEAYDFATTYEHTDSLVVGSAGALYDIGVYDTDMYPASGLGSSRIELNRSSRSIRLKFINSNSSQIFGLIGWVIVYADEDYKQ